MSHDIKDFTLIFQTLIPHPLQVSKFRYSPINFVKLNLSQVVSEEKKETVTNSHFLE